MLAGVDGPLCERLCDFAGTDRAERHRLICAHEGSLLAADTGGLDLVTVQDHTYQAMFLDTWTLPSVIAAQRPTCSSALCKR